MGDIKLVSVQQATAERVLHFVTGLHKLYFILTMKFMIAFVVVLMALQATAGDDKVKELLKSCLDGDYKGDYVHGCALVIAKDVKENDINKEKLEDLAKNMKDSCCAGATQNESECDSIIEKLKTECEAAE